MFYHQLIELFPAITLGIFFGTVTGIIPGIGIIQSLSVIYLLIMHWTPLELLVFYMCLVTVSQYVDSIPSIYLGVPGESGAIPTAYESTYITSKSIQWAAIKWSAIGRTVGCTLAVLATTVIVGKLSNMSVLFSARVQALMILMAMLGLFFTSNNSRLVNLILMTFGFLLGMIGYNAYLDINILTFDLPELYSGISFIPLITGIYLVPSLVTSLANYSPPLSIEHANLDDETPSLPKLRFTIARSSVLGYITGLIPGISFVLSSTVSYHIEKWLAGRKDKYQPGHLPSIVACETGNSVGAFSTLLPLLFFGLPITASESLIYNLMINSGANFQQGSFLLDNSSILLITFLITIVVSVIISWPLSRYFLKAFTLIDLRKVYVSAILLGIATVFLMGWLNNSVIVYFVTFLICLTIGMLLKNFDTLPLIFVFLMQGSIESTIHDIVTIYF
jgi:putative tricarboxylic transport membrane protein